MELVKGNDGIGKLFLNPFDECLGHVNGSIGYLLRFTTVCLQITDKPTDGGMVFSFGAEQQLSSG